MQNTLNFWQLDISSLTDLFFFNLSFIAKCQLKVSDVIIIKYLFSGCPNNSAQTWRELAYNVFTEQVKDQDDHYTWLPRRILKFKSYFLNQVILILIHINDFHLI